MKLLLFSLWRHKVPNEQRSSAPPASKYKVPTDTRYRLAARSNISRLATWPPPPPSAASPVVSVTSQRERGLKLHWWWWWKCNFEPWLACGVKHFWLLLVRMMFFPYNFSASSSLQHMITNITLILSWFLIQPSRNDLLFDDNLWKVTTGVDIAVFMCVGYNELGGFE